MIPDKSNEPLVRVALLWDHTHMNKQAYPLQRGKIRHSWSQTNTGGFFFYSFYLLNALVTLLLFGRG